MSVSPTTRRFAAVAAFVFTLVSVAPSAAFADTTDPLDETVTVPSPTAPPAVPDPAALLSPSADPSADPSASASTVAPAVGDDTVGTGEVPAVVLDPYRSLAFAMTSFYAQRAGESMSTFVVRNAPALASFGAIDLDLSGLGRDDPEALMAQLASVDLFATLPGLTSGGVVSKDDSTAVAVPAAVPNMVSPPALSLDDAVVLKGASWASNLASLRMPDALDVPRPQVSSPEALATGVVLNRSLINFVNDSPDLFAQVSQNGVGSPKAQAAWRKAMSQAVQSANGSMTAMFPSPCSASMLAAMGTGSAKDAAKLAGTGCTPCLTAGLYVNSQMGGLFGPQNVSALPQGSPGLIPPGEWNQLPSWQQDLLKGASPSLSSGLNSTLAQSGSCQSASAATSSALSGSLPGIFSQLSGGGSSSGGSLPGPFAGLRR